MILDTLLETPHVIVAAAIAYKIGNPLVVVPLALGSHFVLEKVPHWNPHLNTELKKFGKLTSATLKVITVDTLLALTAGFYLAQLALPNTALFLTILACCFAGALPDIVEAPYYLWHKRNKYLEKFIKFQKSLQNDTRVSLGLLTQAITIIAAVWWIFT